MSKVIVETVKDLALALNVEPLTFTDLLYARWGLNFSGEVWGVSNLKDPDTGKVVRRNVMTVIDKVAVQETPVEPILVETMMEFIAREPVVEVTAIESPAPVKPAKKTVAKKTTPRKGGLVEVLNKGKETPQ